MKNKEFLFVKSAFAREGSFMTNEQVVKWIEEQNEKVHVKIDKIPFRDLKLWNAGNTLIQHDTGKFFSIIGIRVKTNWETVAGCWEQPIINQPEVGFLGFITKEFDGVLHFLMQAKIEPGNINYVQLSPTLQATKSNYTKAHRGNAPLYLEYFQNATPQQVLLDQLQSEQGARFLRKRNRNIIIKIEEDIPVCDNFIWLTLGQIKVLMSKDNLVNMDTRTVISGIPFGSYEINQIKGEASFYPKDELKRLFVMSALTKDKSLHSIDFIISFITNLKSVYELEVEKIPLKSISGWEYGEKEIRHESGKYFKLIAVNVEIGNREVINWTQPMIEPVQEGLCAFICKKIDGVLHFAVQAKLECGNFDIVELAPTVQSLTGNYKETVKIPLPFLDYVLNAKKENVIYDSLQSEEGGRFYREQNRNMIIIAGDNFPTELPDKFIWMTLNQLYTFLKYNNYLNIQARSLIAAISFI
jgi:oxidase EvaA